ncbi:MAG: type II secretion system F family protein [Candidatus Hadarchaeota archaeon]|nr:type II secretion system F family protein [Candidatus Hadarchaeota archaeon]
MGIVERTAAFVKKIFPQDFLKETDLRLESTNIVLSAEEYIGSTVLISIPIAIVTLLLGFILGSPLLMILTILVFITTFSGLSYVLPYYLTQRRVRELERVLPDGLRQMASTLRAGLGIDAAMDDIAKSGYGALSREFERAVVEIRRGRALENALKALARRSSSPLYKRAFHLITEGIERGAAIADVLDSVSTDARQIQTVQRERRAATTQQVLFLLVAAIFAAPLIAGIVIEVGSGFTALGDQTTGLPTEVSTIVMLYIAIQAFICALAVGVIRYGQMMKGFMFVVPFIIGAVIMFYVAQILIGFVMPA